MQGPRGSRPNRSPRSEMPGPSLAAVLRAEWARRVRDDPQVIQAAPGPVRISGPVIPAGPAREIAGSHRRLSRSPAGGPVPGKECPSPPRPLSSRVSPAGAPVRVIDVHGRQVLHLLLGDREPDAAARAGHGADRDGYLLTAPQMALLEEHVGHVAAAPVD